MGASGPPDGRKPNHLAGQTSPYLLQHLYNPVDWYAWGPEALEKARTEDKPIFLSIGYAACHWCHVMERESFEDGRTAALLNEHFVPIKVDREERPDLDEIYMHAVQLLTGQGGWPLNVFLTPQLQPFMGGTYFPPEDRAGRSGFPEILRRIREAWAARREEIGRAANEMTRQLQHLSAAPVDDVSRRKIDRSETSRAIGELTGRFEPRWGGFGRAPKFPPDGALALLLHEHVRSGEAVPLQMTEKTLDGMALGGMYDHLGGGFARYSVDDRWLVPHFEKMLYNQALLVPVYLDAWLITRKPLYRRVVEQTLDFVGRELTDPDGGGFYSSLDADSEGAEGKYYVWTTEEIVEILGPEDGELFNRVYGIVPRGNFEGKSIPNLLVGSLAEQAAALGRDERELADRLEPLRRRLLTVRQNRVAPGTDDKILTSWNGLMITAFCRAYQVLGRESDLNAARRAADFVMARLHCDGRLRVSFRDGRAQLNGYLDDYAFLARALLDLYEAAFEPRYLEQSRTLATTMVARFEDAENGGFFFTSDDHESLLTRSRSRHDSALPAGSAVATELLLRLAVHVNSDDLRQSAERNLESCRPIVSRMPSAYSSLLLAAELAARPPHEIAILGAADDAGTRALLDVVRRRYLLRPVLQVGPPQADPELLALLSGKEQLEGKPTAYVCRNYACQRPTIDPAELARQLDA